MLSFLRFRRGKRDQKRRRSTTSWSPALESLEELILLSSTPGWMTSATSSINVAPARVTATKLVVTTTPPTSVTANAPFGLTVTAENGSGKIATTYNGRVTLALSGGTSGAKLGGTVTITAVNGVAAFTGLTINTAGTGYTLTASSGTLTSAKSSINVAPVTATQLVVTTTPPTSVTANAPFGLTVAAENGSGKIATTYNGRVTLALSGGTSGAKLGGTVTVTAVNGVATFSKLTINTAGTYTLTASSGTLTANSSINVAPAPVTATKLVVALPPTGVTANAQFGLTVTAEDGSGNVATTYTTPVTLALSSGATLGGTVIGNVVNGVATFSKLTINTAGTYTLTASSGTLTANSSINVAPAPVTATKLVVALPPTGVTANAQFGLTVTAEDGSGNVATTYTTPVTLALSSGATLGGTVIGNVVNGVATFSKLTINTAGTYTLTASSGTLTANSSINVAPAPVTATKLVVALPPTGVTANAQFGLTVTAEDGSGKIATTYTTPVTLALSSGATLGGTVIGNVVNGVATFSKLTINTAGTYTLTASSGTLTANSSINVAPAPVTATKLVVALPPTGVTANAQFGLTVTAEDGSGNVATTYTTPVTLALSSGATLGGTVIGNVVNGVATFSKLTINTAGTYTLTASSGTLTANSSINVAPAPVTATKLVVALPPTGVTANAQFGLTVTAEDGSGNVATTYTTPVTLALSSGATLGGTVIGNVVNGVATFSKLTINTAGTYTLTASSGTLTPAPVTVTVTTASSTEPTAIPVISFHGISNEGPYDVPLSTFTADMTALHNAGYHSITLQQYLDWEAGKNPVLPSKPILLTDDDGDASIQQMTSVLQSDGYTMVAFIVTGFIDNGDTDQVTWAQLQSMVASGTWEVAFHAGADGHYDYANGPPPGQRIEPNAPDFYADYFTANNGGVLETDAQYQARVTTELNQGIAELKAKIPSAYTNVFAPPFNDYGEESPDSEGGPQQQDLTTIFASRFTIVFVQDNNYPNSVDNNHHQYRFEVDSYTSTSDLLAALNDPAFTRFGLTVALTATQVVVTTPPPASVTAGGTFSLTVTAEDDAGKVDTTYNGPVMLILNGSDATATLGGAPVGEDGGNIVDAINGVATFSNLTINTAGTGYTINAFAVDLPGWAETDRITVT